MANNGERAWAQFLKSHTRKDDAVVADREESSQKAPEPEIDIVAESKIAARNHDWSPQAKAAYAEKQLNEYLQKPETKQKQVEDIRQRQQEMDRDETQTFAPTSDVAPPAPKMDETEARLRAEAQHARREADKAEDSAVARKDKSDIDSLSDEERAMLDQYAVNQIRDQNLPVELVGSSFMKTAQQEAAPLIGKIGQKRANELAETFMRQQNEQLAADVEEKARQQATEHGVLSNAATIPINAVTGLIGSVGQLQGMARNTGRYKTLDPNAVGTIGQTYVGAVRDQTTQNIMGEDTTILNKALAVGYQTVMSAADNIARGFLGGGAIGGAALAATGSFSQTMADASRNGATPAQAAILATTTAAIEALSEKIPLDRLITQAKGGKQAVGTIIKNALLQAGIEATTEEISLLGSLLMDAAVMQEKSGFNQTVIQNIIKGKSAAEARAIAAHQIWDEIVNTALVSAGSGAMSSAASGTYANYQAKRAETASKNMAQTAQGKAQAAKEAAQQLSKEEQAQTPAAEAQPVQTAQQPVEQPQQTQQAKTDEEILNNAIRKTIGKDPEVKTTAESTPIEDTYTDVQPRASDVQEQSAEGGQPENIKGTGAAERNFTGSAAYEDMLYDGNIQKQRPGSVRDVEIPKKDLEGRRVTEFASNVVSAEVTPDSVADAVKSLIADKELSFDTRTNQQSLDNAANEIKNSDPHTIMTQIHDNAKDGIVKDGDIEKGMILIAEYANNPEKQAEASSLIVDLAALANMSGRNLQLFSLLKRMTPEGQLMTIQKQVERNVESMIKNGSVQKDYVPDIDPELSDAYLQAAKEAQNAKTPERKKQAEEVMKQTQDAIYATEAAKMPSTFKAKWDALRYMAMLGNAKTQVRNVAGNIAFAPYKIVKDKMAAVFEKALPKEQRTKSIGTDFALLKWAQADAKSESVRDALKYSAKLGDDMTSEKLRENVQIFNTKALESFRRFVEKVPQAGDMLFKNKYYEHSLAGFLRARGYTINDIQNGNISEGVLNEGRAYAIQEAMKATFNDSNVFSDAIASIGRNGKDNPVSKAFNYMGESILPFRRTPANIVVRFEEYSPVGLANTVWKAAHHIKNGDISAASALDSLASTFTGTGAMLLGYFLANGIAGFKLTGSNTDEDEKRQGHQDYALEFSIDGQDYSYKVDWAAPANLPLFVGANINRMRTDAGAETDVSKFTSALRGIGNMFEPMLALSCLSSLNDLVEGIRYAPEGEALYTAAADIATGYFTQGIPALLRQTAQATQKNKQITFANSSDPTIRDIQKTVAGVPFVGSGYQTDKINAWGETESRGDLVTRAVNAYFNPGTISKINNSQIESEITRLNKAQTENVSPPEAAKVVSYTDKNGNVHKDVRLTAEQYTTLAKTQGQTAKAIISDMIQNSNYQAMTDQQKAKAFEKVYAYAKEKGEQAAIGDDHLGYSEEWMMKLSDNSETAANDILRRITNSELNRTMENMNAAWDNNFDSTVTQTKSRELAEAYDSYAKMTPAQRGQVKQFAAGDTEIYINAREKGLSHDTILTVQKAMNSIKPENGAENPNQKQKMETIAKSPGLTEAQKAIMGKLYGSDAQDENIGEVAELTKELRAQGKQTPRISSDFELYAYLYRDHEDYTKDTGKKKRTTAKWVNDLGIDQKTAEAYYKLFS